MAFARLSWLMFAVLVLPAVPAAAQDAPGARIPTPPDPAGPVPVPLPPTAGPAFPIQATTPATCSCGGRHGVSRWWWHKTQCKRKLQEHAIGYPEEFNEWPLGKAAYDHARTQVSNGAAARMVFYDYDFEDGSSKLKLRGEDKLREIATALPTNFFPVIIERTPPWAGLDPARSARLEQERRATILAALAGGPFPVPPQRVVVGRPVATGLSGQEAILVNANQLGLTAAGGGFGGAPVGGVGLDADGLSGSAVATPGR